MKETKDYEVGYQKPPKQSQFKPGKSGNPMGRPKGTKDLATDLREELSQMIQVTENGKPQRISKQRAVLKALSAKAVKGDTRAIGIILNLLPSVEQAEKELDETQTLSKSDQTILVDYLAKNIR
jgi:hypothetical protein